MKNLIIALLWISWLSYYFYSYNMEYARAKSTCETKREILYNQNNEIQFVWIISWVYIQWECLEIYKL